MNAARVATLLALFIANGKRQNTLNEEEDRKVIIKNEYDFIVVGAGTSGSVVASRLAEFKNVNILVLEAGQSGRDDPIVDVPIFAAQLAKTERDWNMTTTPQKNVISINGPKITEYPRGRVGGGSSALNYHAYIRGSEYDYKLWEDEGANGWSLGDLRKYFDKVENGANPGMSASVYKGGKLKLGRPMDTKVTRLVGKAANEIGIPSVDYLDGGGLTPGASRMTETVVGGKRQYGLNSYLYPTWTKRKAVLDIAYGAHVHKILFRDDLNGKKEAFAVIFKHNGKMREVQVRKEVILSAGVFNTPQLLMLSGVGPSDHLKEMNIEVVADVPGVGTNSEDHTAMPFHFYGDKYPEDEAMGTIAEYAANGTGPMSTSAAFSNMINLRSTSLAAPSSEKYPFCDINFHVLGFGMTTKLQPDIEQALKREYETAEKSRKGVLYHVVFYILLSHARSKGTVRLRSADPNDLPIYDPNQFSDSRDYSLMIEAIRIAEKFEESPEFKKYGLKMVMIPDHCKKTRKWPMCYVGPLEWTGRYKTNTCNRDEKFDTKKIPRSEEFYKCYLAQMAQSFVHGTSTCKIGKKENKMSVVDSRLRLHAVSGLRIVDASVMPHVTSANPQSTCYVIGEKAADMIREDWNLSVDE